MTQFTPGANGTHFYMVPLSRWNAFMQANNNKLPVWWQEVRLTEAMLMVAYQPPDAERVLFAGGLDLRSLNTGSATNPIPNPITIPRLIPDFGAPQPTGSSFRLTSSQPTQTGAVWFPDRQYLAGGFIATFQFQMAGAGSVRSNIEPGGDGFAFVIQDHSLSPPRLPGGFLGYHGIPRSLAIEFDTYQNFELGFYDPDGNHISVHSRGVLQNSVSELASIGRVGRQNLPTLNDGFPHLAQVLYVPGRLSIFVDDLSRPVLEIGGLDLARALQLRNGQAWLGFTAATYASFQSHDILHWDFRTLTPFGQN
jgi:hypothetical protein